MSYTEMGLTAAALFCALIAAYEIWDHRRTLEQLEATRAQLAGMAVRLDDTQRQLHRTQQAIAWSQYLLDSHPLLTVFSRN